MEASQQNRQLSDEEFIRINESKNDFVKVIGENTLFRKIELLGTGKIYTVLYH